MDCPRHDLPHDQGRGRPHGRPPDGRDAGTEGPRSESGTLSGKAIAKLAGLAPIARDSGQSSGRRPVRGGRSGVRAILFVVAGCVRRFDPAFSAFDQRLRQAGKPPKVIRVALAYKLLVRLNAKAREVHAQMAQAA